MKPNIFFLEERNMIKQNAYVTLLIQYSGVYKNNFIDFLQKLFFNSNFYTIMNKLM